MLNMQAFHLSLSAAAAAPAPRQDRLAALTRVKRDRILALTSELTWFIWSEEQDESAQ